MTDSTSTFDLAASTEKLNAALAAGKLTQSAVENITSWITERRYAKYASQVVEHIDQEKWAELDDVFWTIIPFGTGGRRGKMYPFGSNAINERTIGESAQGLADYVLESKPDGPWSAAIAYDTRHRSREFAELCAGILVANGFVVYFLDDYRSTPELSYLIRFKNCDCGIMVTASHNPPSDNAVKVYWSSGAQLIPPHDKEVIDRVATVEQFEIANFQASVDSGQVIMCRQETDAALMQEHVKHASDGPRDLKVIYSPLHGVGEFNVRTLLEEVGFNELEIYEPHREPNGDFPNVPGHVSNPENKEVFLDIIERAKQNGSELILATDPDCDRMGAAAPTTTDTNGSWDTFTGNQLGVMLADFVLGNRQRSGELSEADYLVTTLVTTPMAIRVAQGFNITCHDNNLVGFKWICEVVDRLGPDNFVFGFEESHGYLVGQYCRDKDGAIACMLMCELAAWVKSQGMSLHEHMDSLYQKYGYHQEHLMTIRMEGSDGMRRMAALMDKFRTDMPKTLGSLNVVSLRDHLNGVTLGADGSSAPMDGTQGNLVFLDTEAPGNCVAARPSGTEPKVKFYLFTYVAPDEISDLGEVKRQMASRIADYETALQAFADSV